MWTYNYNLELYHHGILGQRWGRRNGPPYPLDRKYQKIYKKNHNSDGSLTLKGQKKFVRYKKHIDKKDQKWAQKNYDKLTSKAYKKSAKEASRYARIKNGKQAYSYAYNEKLAELMTESVKNISAPSGKAVKFIAKRGKIGVHMALADINYDMNNIKNGIWENGRIAYKKKHVNMV